MIDYFRAKDVEKQVKMDTDEEREFHYFKLHDYDHNNKLDGLEITAAILHNNIITDDIFSEEMLKEITTQYLENDINEDGFVDYYEFRLAQDKKNQKLDLKSLHVAN